MSGDAALYISAARRQEDPHNHFHQSLQLSFFRLLRKTNFKLLVRKRLKLSDGVAAAAASASASAVAAAANQKRHEDRSRAAKLIV